MVRFGAKKVESSPPFLFSYPLKAASEACVLLLPQTTEEQVFQRILAGLYPKAFSLNPLRLTFEEP